jgi:hypothetical protein
MFFPGHCSFVRILLSTYYTEQAVCDCALDGLFYVKAMDGLFVLVLLLRFSLAYGEIMEDQLALMGC